MNTNEITSFVVNAVSTINENNEVVAFDLATLDEVIKELRTVAKDARTKFKDDEKAKKDADKATLAERGRIYYKNLAEGDEFSYTDASGKEWACVKIETKSKTGTTAACELIDPPEGAKNTKRYPKFHQVVVPADWTMPVAENTSENASENVA